MDYPINYSFVTSQAKMMDEQLIHVLVLDKEANDAYFKRMYSFAKFLSGLNLTSLDQADRWEISTKFAGDIAMVDLVSDLEGHPTNPLTLTKFFNVPVTWVEADEEFCRMVLADGSIKENNDWK